MSEINPVPNDMWQRYRRFVILEGFLYIILQASLYFLPINPYTDYFNHINW